VLIAGIAGNRILNDGSDIERAHARGLTIWAGTLLPRKGVPRPWI
jgi:hypothetical protein